MKKHLPLAVAALTLAVAANAKCWRINPNPNAKAQFKTVAEAMKDLNVFPGDTLLLDPGNHGRIELTQENITLIGTGYFLDQNHKWSEIDESRATYIGLSKNSKVEGVAVSGTIAFNENCVITRCIANNISSGGSHSTAWDMTIDRCLIKGDLYFVGDIKNNIVLGRITADGPSRVIENNTVIGDNTQPYLYLITGRNVIIRNNIVINTAEGINDDRLPKSYFNCIDFNPSYNNTINNNVLSTPAEYADANYPNNHYVGATVENTFVMSGSDDAKYQLLETSAAKKAASNGGDCGAFGGETPYILSGIPMLQPHITEAIVPKKPTDGKITMKIKLASQDE